eukprot:4499028-Pyramimonas_sp.AAC.1
MQVSAWGGYVFVINLLPVYVLALVVAGRWSERLYVAYSIFYTLGTILAMNICTVGTQHVQSGEHMAAMAVFAFVQVRGADWSVVRIYPRVLCLIGPS